MIVRGLKTMLCCVIRLPFNHAFHRDTKKKKKKKKTRFPETTRPQQTSRKRHNKAHDWGSRLSPLPLPISVRGSAAPLSSHHVQLSNYPQSTLLLPPQEEARKGEKPRTTNTIDAILSGTPRAIISRLTPPRPTLPASVRPPPC